MAGGMRRGVLAHPHRLNDNEAEAVAQPLSTVFSFIPHITSCLSLGILSFFPTGDSSLCCRMDRGWTRHLHCKPSLGKMYNPTMAASRVLQAKLGSAPGQTLARGDVCARQWLKLQSVLWLPALGAVGVCWTHNTKGHCHPRASSAKTRGFHTQLDGGPETP